MHIATSCIHCNRHWRVEHSAALWIMVTAVWGDNPVAEVEERVNPDSLLVDQIAELRITKKASISSYILGSILRL